MSNPGELAKKVAIGCLVRAREPDDLGTEQRTVKQKRVPEARQQELTIPAATTLTARGPAPYQQHLMPIPSHLRPHCLAKDRLRLWAPAPLALGHTHTPGISEAEQVHVKDTMLHAWEEDTRVSYGAGLLMWHCFCDVKGIPESERAPTSQALLSAFVAHLASAYSGKTIAGYVNGVRAWHILNNLPWALEKKAMDTILRAAEKLTPNTSRRKKRCPFTPMFISAIRSQLDLDRPLDAAVFACLTTCFYASARLGEFMVRTLNSFSPTSHVTKQHLSYDQDRNSFRVTVLHLPRTKTAGSDGEDIYWASQDGDMDPIAALAQHLQVNQPSEASHLFAYKATNTRHPLTRSKFLERMEAAAHAAGLEPLQGHGIRISSTLEYLL